MAQLSASAATIASNLARVEQRITEACERAARDPAAVRVLVACKYVAAESLAALAEAGVKLVGENRLQDLVAKQADHRDRFEWHFIGSLQSRKTAEVTRRVSMIHSVASESVAAKLRALEGTRPACLVQVNLSGEATKDGVAPDLLDEFAALLPESPRGLMTMPPPTGDDEQVRPYFRRLAELAGERGWSELSMGTSQDYAVAVEEGATIVRIGAELFREPE